MKTSHILSLIITITSIVVVCWGVQIILTAWSETPPPISLPVEYYEGGGLIIFGLLVACLRNIIAQKLLWLFAEMYRWISALLLAIAVGADGVLHLLNIPHVEGWWIPILGGGALASTIAAWIHKWRKK